MKPGGLERDRSGRETRQSITQREGRGRRAGFYAKAGRITNRLAGLLFFRAWHVASPPRPLATQERAARRSSRSIAWHCYHQAVKTFEELKLWNDMIFVDLPKHRRLVCSQCGSRNVRVMPIEVWRRACGGAAG
jgi:hypothetical protein